LVAACTAHSPSTPRFFTDLAIEAIPQRRRKLLARPRGLVATVFMKLEVANRVELTRARVTLNG